MVDTIEPTGNLSSNKPNNFMESPTIPFLRPLRLGELLDQAIRIYRHNFATFIGIVALSYIPYALLTSISTWMSLSATVANTTVETSREPFAVFSSPFYWIAVLIGLFARCVYTITIDGFSASAMANNILRGQFGYKTGIIDSYRQIGPLAWQIIATMIIFMALMIVAFIWFIVPCIGWISGFGVLLFLGSVTRQFLPAILVVEKISGMKAISRAWHMARRHFWWLIGFTTVLVLFNLIAVTGPELLARYILGTFFFKGLGLEANIINSLLSSTIGDLFHMFLLPIFFTAQALAYFDLRIRTEGFDLAIASLDPSSETLTTDITQIPPAPAAPEWLNADDIGKLIIVSIVGGAIYIGIAIISILVTAISMRGTLTP